MTLAQLIRQKIYEHERAQYVLGEKTHEVRPLKLKELIDDYLEYSKANKRSYRDDVSLAGRVLAHFGDCMAQEVTQQSIERYKTVRHEKKVAEHMLSGSTINRELAFLKVVFSKAVTWKKAQHNPVLGVRFFNEREKARVRYLTQAQQENLQVNVRRPVERGGDVHSPTDVRAARGNQSDGENAK